MCESIHVTMCYKEIIELLLSCSCRDTLRRRILHVCLLKIIIFFHIAVRFFYPIIINITCEILVNEFLQ